MAVQAPLALVGFAIGVGARALAIALAEREMTEKGNCTLDRQIGQPGAVHPLTLS